MQLERPTFCIGKRRNSVCTIKAITANQNFTTLIDYLCCFHLLLRYDS